MDTEGGRKAAAAGDTDAVDQDGEVIDILVQSRRDRRAAERFFRRLLREQGRQPLSIITDGLRSYAAAMRTNFCHVAHTSERYANNRIDASRQPTRQRERQMRGSSLPSRPNRFSPSMAWSTICSDSDATNQIKELPVLAVAILFDLANNDRGLRLPGNN